MAKPITFTPHRQEQDAAAAARDELDALLVNLHERGILRLLNGLLAAGPEVSAIAMDGLTSPGGQRAIRNVVTLGAAATKLDPERFDALLSGIVRGIEQAGARLEQEPPGSVSLVRAFNDPEVRRGMHALLGFLKALGEQEAD